jgi:uncharacterized membrane protein
MAKQTRSHKQVQLTGHQGKGYHQENTEVFDDNLLPDALEIRALSEIDPEILIWLKARAEKEQDFRHDVFNKRTKILESDVKAEHRINYMGMIFAFLIIMSGMAFSTYLINKELIITGSIFSGLTILYAAALFYKRKGATLPMPTKKEL